MSHHMVISVISLVFVIGLLDAAQSDLRQFRIPNRVPLLLLAGFVPAALVAGLDWQDWLIHLGVALAFFVLGALLFARGVWGGGDAKLLPAVALWIGVAGLPRFLVIMALAGGALAVLALLSRRIALGPIGPLRAWGQRLAESGHVPYGVAMAVGGLDWWAAVMLSPLLG